VFAVALLGGVALEAAGPARLVPFERDGKWGYKTSQGRVAIEPRYTMALEYSAEGIAAVVDEQGWAYIDRSGKLVIRPLAIDNGPDYFVEGLARFRVDGKIGFFERHGRVVIQPRYGYAMPFSQGRSAVCDGCREVAEGEHRFVRGGRWGFIDSAGALVIPLQFEDAGSFDKGRARVRLNGRWIYINRKGTGNVGGLPVQPDDGPGFARWSVHFLPATQAAGFERRRDGVGKGQAAMQIAGHRADGQGTSFFDTGYPVDYG
jgi:hypothetical protein